MVLGEIAFVFRCLRLLSCLFHCRSTDFLVVYPVSWAGCFSSAQLTVPPTVFSWCLSNFFEWSCLFPVISPSFDNPFSSSVVIMIPARSASSSLSRLGSSHPVSDDHDDVPYPRVLLPVGDHGLHLVLLSLLTMHGVISRNAEESLPSIGLVNHCNRHRPLHGKSLPLKHKNIRAPKNHMLHFHLQEAFRHAICFETGH